MHICTYRFVIPNQVSEKLSGCFAYMCVHCPFRQHDDCIDARFLECVDVMCEKSYWGMGCTAWSWTLPTPCTHGHRGQMPQRLLPNNETQLTGISIQRQRGRAAGGLGNFRIQGISMSRASYSAMIFFKYWRLWGGRRGLKGGTSMRVLTNNNMPHHCHH